jgi:hypothetical protein
MVQWKVELTESSSAKIVIGGKIMVRFQTGSWGVLYREFLPFY